MEFKDVKQFIEDNKSTEEVRVYLESISDKHANTALETWKKNNLDNLVADKIRERYPEEDERDITIKELQSKFEDLEREKTREILRNVALKEAASKGLPVDLVEYFIGNDEALTLENLGKFEKVFNEAKEASGKSRLKDEAYTPPKSDSKQAITAESFSSMTNEERSKLTEDEINSILD